MVANQMNKLFVKQNEFTKEVLSSKKFDLSNLTENDKVFWTKEYVIAMMKELAEVLDNLDWKHHRKRIEKTHLPNVLEELIDLQKYLWGMMSIWQVNYLDFVDAFKKKSFVVEERFRMEKVSFAHPSLFIDLDGVISKYPESFLQWIKREYPNISLISKRENPILWEEMKNKYRTDGGKQEAIVVPGVKQFLQSLRSKGWQIVIFTYRPIHLFKSIEYDTLFWLQKSKIPFDKIVWAIMEKSFYLSSGALDCDVFIDDDVETCLSVANIGKKVFCMTDRPLPIPTFSSFNKGEAIWQICGN